MTCQALKEEKGLTLSMKENFPFVTNDKTLNNKLQKAIERGNLTATSDNNIYSKADIVLVSINCDLINENDQDKIALSSFKNSIKK